MTCNRLITYEGPITCRLCGETRPHTDFYERPESGRRRGECKFCIRARAQASSDRVTVGDERWLRRREGVLRRKYGMTNAEFDRLAIAQNGRCAICGEIPKVRRRNTRTGREWTALHVDHDHRTGRVRGLLCHRCNSQVGWAERIGFKAVIEYLA